MSGPARTSGSGTGSPDEHHRQLVRGFNWLGGATVVARIIDVLTTLSMLLLLTRKQVGVASLVLSIGMVVEAFNGLGTGQALIQARSVSRTQLDTVFWCVLGTAAVTSGLTLLAAPWIGTIYGMTGMTGYFVAIAAKQPLVGAAVVPLAMMNRNLQYRRIATVNLCATIAAASIRLMLGIGGAGAWALVAGYASSGLFILMGAMTARPFRPRLRFQPSAISGLLRFGLGATMADASEQTFKNVDYLLVGWFYGASALAVYRVAFDVAMEPAMAVGTLVNRTALPVLSRVSAAHGDLTHVLAWSLRKIATLVAPLAVALVLGAGPLTALLHDRHGNSYAAAAGPLELLAAAALLRVLCQPLFTVMLGSGRPGMAARLSAVTLLLLAGGIAVAGATLPVATGLLATSAIWLGIYPLLLVWGLLFLHRHEAIDIRALGRVLSAPMVAVGILVVVVETLRHLFMSGGAAAQLAVVLGTTLLCYLGLLRLDRPRA